MDCDTEIIVNLIYPNGVSDKWKDNNEIYSFINKLGTYDVEQLNKSPDHINCELSSLQNQTQDLAFNHYKTFIQASDCAHSVLNQFNESEESLKRLLCKLPDTKSKCEEFVSRAREMEACRRVNTLCLTKHSTVLQLLETVQLLETCIRAGMYEEALQLASFVRRLARTHHNVPVLQDLVNEVDRIWWVLVSRLLNQLRTDLALPRCLQVMGHLRRMDVLTPVELKLKFLVSRDLWFQSQLADVTNDDPASHLSKVIELSRNHLFNIITQYKAVFSEEDSSALSPLHSSHDMPVLQAWISDKVCEFMRRLETGLEAGVGGAIVSLMSQCMYFGQSMGRVAADLRPCLVKPFLKVIAANFDNEMEKAKIHFQTDMDKFQVSTSDSLLFKIPLDSESNTSYQLSPPGGLLEFYPLCCCCNSMVSGLNELRLCAPLALAQHVTDSLNCTLLHVSTLIINFYTREQQALSDEERARYSKLCSCFAHEFVPYIQRCLHAIYSPSEISSYLNVSMQQVQSQGLTFLDEAAIMKPVEHLLPVNMSLVSESSVLMIHPS